MYGAGRGVREADVLRGRGGPSGRTYRSLLRLLLRAHLLQPRRTRRVHRIKPGLLPRGGDLALLKLLGFPYAEK